jgi:hypothetical protein
VLEASPVVSNAAACTAEALIGLGWLERRPAGIAGGGVNVNGSEAALQRLEGRAI